MVENLEPGGGWGGGRSLRQLSLHAQPKLTKDSKARPAQGSPLDSTMHACQLPYVVGPSLHMQDEVQLQGPPSSKCI